MINYIYGSDGRALGYIIEGSIIEAIGIDGTYLGNYNPVTNMTYDRIGNIVQLNGNALNYLIISHAVENNL